MTDANEPISPWWRCSGYEIVDDHIRPKRDSRVVQYEPWATFTKYRSSTKIGEQYLSLLNLRGALEARSGTAGVSSIDLTDGDKELITRWCTKNGLLGLLHHRTLAIFREPFGQHDGDLSAIDAVAWRRGGRWLNQKHAPRTVERFYAVEPQALFEHRLGGPVKPLSLESLRDDFFPEIRNSQSPLIPLPGDTNFWSEYSEPVSMFIEAMEDLARAVQFTRRRSDSANATMVDLLTGVSPIGVRREGKVFSLEWSCPSLLASFATMALICHDRQQPPGRCANEGCFKWFVGSVTQEYCTPTCQGTAETRRKRARRKAIMSSSAKSAVGRDTD